MTDYNYRFSIIPAGAVTDRRLKPRDLQVLCLLGRHTDHMGWCRRSQVKMAHELACSRGSVQSALERLYEAGWVERKLEGRGSIGPDPEKQPFASHSYRVRIDHDEPIETPNKEGCQPAGTPSEMAPGASPELARGANPELAPLEGTPSNLPLVNERESAGAREVKRLPVTAFLRRWPSAAVDSRTAIESAWETLPDDQLQPAIDGIEPFIAELKRMKRSHTPSGATYLRERKWVDLPAAEAKPQNPFAVFKCWSREWWAALFVRIDRGEPTAVMLERAVQQGSREWSERSERMPASEVIANLKAYPSDSAVLANWRPWFQARGVRLPAWDKKLWVFLPSEEPPISGVPALGRREPTKTGPPTVPTFTDEDIDEFTKSTGSTT